MTEFILKYWVEVMFGLIVSGLSFACRRYWKLWRAEQQHQKTEEQEAFYSEYLTQKRKQIIDGVISKMGIV